MDDPVRPRGGPDGSSIPCRARVLHRLAVLSSGSGWAPDSVITDREGVRSHLSGWFPDP
ncbi:hypothetical protein Ae168Ps1_0658c [Pseudonocardia sp. Ae168_Ps1]|nr:hypothetical protein Ae150APs1_0659c [Pseudonocardia sp. Ae150A_Ps1]OLL78252.1 hypothetical protein Ae168Ps1_0658c [Pseudonocardia sp. Ae168_Ps1]OLL87623.1 hypothetical protein Ae263Ps1_4678 [Pseudonocardia sp. Ae263_Ps1]OLL92348.1 hypothetical protein Ae356Ps1_2245c [Pseudonocardia sp. Ae356_Ps1]